MVVKTKHNKSYIKLFILILLVFNTLTQFNIQGQQINLDKKITIVVKDKPLGQVLKEIEQNAGLNFSYSNQQIDDGVKITLVSRHKAVGDILSQLFNMCDIEYILVEKQVILKPKKPVKEEPKEIIAEIKYNTLNGYVKDAETGEALIGASIKIKDKPIGTLTNNYGFFSITLPQNHYTLEISYLGYQMLLLDIDLIKDLQIAQTLKLDEKSLEVIVIAAKENSNINDISPLKKISFSPYLMSTKVGISGDADLIQIVQSIPGIQSQSDGSVFFFTRGGNKDQNLILVDDAPIYNPTHFFGFFSTIPPEAINEVSVYKNHFPLQYGGRLSSIVDIHTKDGNMNNFQLDGDINPLTKSIGLQGPIIKEKASYFLSFRSSNLNWINEMVKNDQRNDFVDINAKLNFRLGSKNKLFFSFYTGNDNIKYFKTGYNTFAIKWQNFASTIRWNHLFSEKLFSNTTIYSSLYDYYLYTSVENNQYWNSLIGNVSLKSDFTFYSNAGNTLKYGIALNSHYFNPGNLNDEFFTRKVPASNALETILYFGHEYKPNSKISLSYGIRLISWSNAGPTTSYLFDENYKIKDTLSFGDGIFHTYNNLEPRIDFNYSANKHNTLKLSYNRNVQNLHLLSNSISPFTTLDIWMPSNLNIKPQLSDQLVLGYFNKHPELEFSVETYYKKMYNQIDYAENANMLLNPLIEGQLRFGSAYSYGAEMTLQKSKGSFTGLINYCYSRVFNKFDGVNNNKTFNPYYDKPHQVYVSLSYKITDRLRVNANWVYSSGNRFSAPAGFYYYNGYSVPFFDQKNNAKLPDYHRLDISSTFRINKDAFARYSHSISVTIINLYGRKNPISVNFNKVETSNGELSVPANYINENELFPTTIYLLGISPTISYRFNFNNKKTVK